MTILIGALIYVGVVVALLTFFRFVHRSDDVMRALHAEREFPAPMDEAELDRKVICPKCHQRMDTHFCFGGGHAVMSTCERCELHWLDGGMLMRIVRMPHLSEE